MSDIKRLDAPAAMSAPPVRTAPSGEVLRLMPPQTSPLASGEDAQAEVVSVRQNGQDFQMLLRLTQANGAQNQVQVSARQPLPEGSQLRVSQPPSGSPGLMVRQLDTTGADTLVRLDTTRTPVGTLLQAKVVTSQVEPQVPGQPVNHRILATLLNTAQAGATLTLDSPRPLAVGSLLSALVEGDQTLRFVPLAGRQEQLVTAQQLLNQQARQASLPGLLAALQALPDDAPLDPALRTTVQTLLSALPDLAQLTDPKGLAQAFARSGAFLEASLLGGQPGGLTGDLKAQMLRLVAQLPGVPGNPTLPPAMAAGGLAQALPGMVRNALGMLGQVGPRPQPGGFPLPARLLQQLSEGEGDLEHLLRLAAAAISRLQNHQLASLQQTGIDEHGNVQTTWQSELALRQDQAFVPIQVKLQREEPPPREDDPPREQRDSLQALWRLDLAFDVDPLGPLQVQAQLSQARLSAQLWAERAETATLLAGQLEDLRAHLVARGLDVGDLACHAGAPPQGAGTRLEQRWVDETA
ncbi:flagellar hook-length control protein FliK [Pseudomonas entomophila]|uniref:flagellar hook-length control protein FliK n=1 Tax=Pseudomonas entomophila TaxID=312306 RepID=UPI0015E3506E|nr:flagellar hook-length control protein FliK [Pseudomonas entomophila]MBA1187877.1 flagellar hook-length control protein FliK [Pseudomonas entomophila]